MRVEINDSINATVQPGWISASSEALVRMYSEMIFRCTHLSFCSNHFYRLKPRCFYHTLLLFRKTKQFKVPTIEDLFGPSLLDQETRAIHPLQVH